MRIFVTLLIVMIPALIALGHDAYLFYEENLNPGRFSMELVEEKFKFTALGYLWTTYDVESYKTTRESVSDEDWANIDFLLTIKAFYAGLAFAGVWIAFFTVLALFGKGPLVKREKGPILVKKR